MTSVSSVCSVSKIIAFGIYLIKVNKRNTRTESEICSKLTLKAPEASFWYLYCYLWTYFTPCSSVSTYNFEHVIIAGIKKLEQLPLTFFNCLYYWFWTDILLHYKIGLKKPLTYIRLDFCIIETMEQIKFFFVLD